MMIAEWDELESGDDGEDKLVAFPSGFVDGRPFYSLRDRIRGEGVEPGDVIRFPEDAKKRVFWDDYPADERAFRCYVLPPGWGESGIEFYAPLELVEKKPLKESYRGIPRTRIGHLCLMWRMDRDRFEAQHGEEVLQAIGEFRADLCRAPRRDLGAGHGDVSPHSSAGSFGFVQRSIARPPRRSALCFGADAESSPSPAAL
jgi:hypothetical protein